MGLIRAIVHGFGVTLGSRAADEAIDEVREALDKAETARGAEAQKAAEQRTRARDAESARKERRRAEARHAREIDRELAALKKRVKRG
jgi:hypothetical protein